MSAAKDKPAEDAKKEHFDPLNNPNRDRPWVFRTYAGHSSAKASNELFRSNLAKGQTGLSVAFDLPTQTGYDSDHPLSYGEVGKVGVPISHIEDMAVLFDQIPLDQMNTSMTINATAAWLLALYTALAERQGVDKAKLSGTIQNDIIKEYLSRGTYIFPPRPSMKLIVDTVTYTVKEIPKWNPTNVCSYHLQEAGATPTQELAYALCTGMAVLDAVKESGQIPEKDFPQVVGRISFFVNAGIRFVEEMCKMRAFTEMWDEICRDRYGIDNAKLRRFRYGVQVNSLCLTEPQPENNIQRIVLEMLAVVLSKNARARAVQLPAWNEALGLPRPWDQQWSLRIQQVMAYETDLLEYADIFDGSRVIEKKVAELIEGAKAEIAKVQDFGGAIPAVENGYMKKELVKSHTERWRGIEMDERVVVGITHFTESAPSPLASTADGGILKVDPKAAHDQIESLQAFRAKRNDADVKAALQGLKDAAKNGDNIMPSSIRAAHAGVTTGEWADALREIFGEYRPPTGIDITTMVRGKVNEIEELRHRVKATSDELGEPIRFLVGKPGLDGHSNGAEQVAVKAREVGMEVIYEGIRLTPDQIVTAAQEEGVHLVGLSILSGSHMEMVDAVITGQKNLHLEGVPLVVGGIIPESDAGELKGKGVKEIYTPKDYNMNQIMATLIDVIRQSHGLSAFGAL
ncbi:MAG: protein meaA [Deltaproteobacteria bacterium]|nr:protein meaA [Deltaproteobacteria bacterium]